MSLLLGDWQVVTTLWGGSFEEKTKHWLKDSSAERKLGREGEKKGKKDSKRYLSPE